MALQQAYANEFVNINDAYHSINSINGDKEKMLVTLSIKKSPESNNDISTFSFCFTPTMDDKNYHQQAYEYLKTLPDFANCVDC